MDPTVVKKALKLIVDSTDEKTVFGINVHDHIQDQKILAVYEERKIKKNPVDHAFSRYMKDLIANSDLRSSKRIYLDALMVLYAYRKYALSSAFELGVAPLQKRFHSLDSGNMESEFGNTIFTVSELKELHPLFFDGEGYRGRSSTLVAPYEFQDDEVSAVGFPKCLYYYQLHKCSQNVARRIFFDLQCSCKNLPGGRRVHGLKCGCIHLEGPYTLSGRKKYTGQTVDNGGIKYRLIVGTNDEDWHLSAELESVPGRAVPWWTCPGTAAMAIPPTVGWRPTYTCPQWLKQPELKLVSIDLDYPGSYDSYLSNIRVGERKAFSYTPIAIDANDEVDDENGASAEEDGGPENDPKATTPKDSSRIPKNG